MYTNEMNKLKHKQNNGKSERFNQEESGKYPKGIKRKPSLVTNDVLPTYSHKQLQQGHKLRQEGSLTKIVRMMELNKLKMRESTKEGILVKNAASPGKTGCCLKRLRNIPYMLQVPNGDQIENF